MPDNTAKRHFYITTAIPYVNGDPHLGHALEFVQADVLARHRRHRGDAVRFLSGTDDNAQKNITSAEVAGTPVVEFVAEKASHFAELAAPLQLSNDDFIRTSTDLRHRPGVERLWAACAAAGDLYQSEYQGRYCVGCEAFLADDDLDATGLCPDHKTVPELISETNWFFRLSRYQDQLLGLIESGALRIEPPHRRNEVLSFIRAGLSDFSASRAQGRAHNWGIPVPEDPGQAVYVWFDALGNYITALDYANNGADYYEWWQRGEERVHVIGKGIIRFHAVYWPAILLSAGEPLPTTIFVHDYLSVDGEKLSKSLGNAIDPNEIVVRYSSDALRWWFLRDVPRNGDADFKETTLVTRANELADGLGNLINRTISLINRYRPDGLTETAPHLAEAESLTTATTGLQTTIDSALAAFDLRGATDALWHVAVEANCLVAATEPWTLAKAEQEGDVEASERLEAVLAALYAASNLLASELVPFLPEAAERISQALEHRDPELGRALFPKF